MQDNNNDQRHFNTRVVDQHSFWQDPDLALQKCGVTFKKRKKLLYANFTVIHPPPQFRKLGFCLIFLYFFYNKITIINNFHAFFYRIDPDPQLW